MASAIWTIDRLYRAGLFLLVVGVDAVDDRRVHAEAAGDVGADEGVSAFDVVVDRLADVVEQAAAAAHADVGADLFRDHARRCGRTRRRA